MQKFYTTLITLYLHITTKITYLILCLRYEQLTASVTSKMFKTVQQSTLYTVY